MIFNKRRLNLLNTADSAKQWLDFYPRITNPLLLLWFYALMSFLAALHHEDWHATPYAH